MASLRCKATQQTTIGCFKWSELEYKHVSRFASSIYRNSSENQAQKHAELTFIYFVLFTERFVWTCKSNDCF